MNPIEYVAHRGGNVLADVQQAERLADIVEIDVHLGNRGRVEVRHAKKLWLTGRHWERWYLVEAGSSFPSLEEVLAHASDDTVFWFDLKGFTKRLPARVLDEVGQRRPLVVSSKAWWLLRPFADLADIRTFRSVGNRFELFLLDRLPTGSKTDGVVVHSRLLNGRVARRLLRRGPLFTWSLDDLPTIRRVVALGVAGVIIDDPELFVPARAAAQGEWQGDAVGDGQTEQ